MATGRHKGSHKGSKEDLENLAYGAWLRRGKPIGSPEVDWEEALKLFSYQHDGDEENDEDDEAHLRSTLSSAPGSTPTDLGADLLPELSHDEGTNNTGPIGSQRTEP
jgi:hypothetical protein